MSIVIPSIFRDIDLYDSNITGHALEDTTTGVHGEHPHDELYVLTLGEKIIWFFFYGVIAFMAVFGNLLVIYVVFTCPR